MKRNAITYTFGQPGQKIRKMNSFCFSSRDVETWVLDKMVYNRGIKCIAMGLVMKFIFDIHTYPVVGQAKFYKTSVQDFVDESYWLGNIGKDMLWTHDDCNWMVVLDNDMKYHLNRMYWKSLGHGYTKTIRLEDGVIKGFVIPPILIEVDGDLIEIPGDSQENPINLD